MLIEALHNGALLCFTALGLYLVMGSTVYADRLNGAILLGLSYGLVAFLVTVSPLETGSGATVDARAGPVIIAGIIGGPVAAVIAACLGAVARWAVGGTFVLSGALVFGFYALAGTLLWRRHLAGYLGAGLSWMRIALGAGLSVLCAALMYLFIEPRAVADLWFEHTLPFIVMANVVSVFLCGVIGKAVLATVGQRHRLEQALETLELAKTSGGIGIWTMDYATGEIVWDDVNRKLHGIRLDSEAGKFEDWARIVHPEDLPRVTREFDVALAGDQKFDTEYRVILPDQKVRYLKGNAVVLRGAAGQPVRIVGANFDISDLVQKDRDLAETRSIATQAQKMEAIGQLTGGVAHDFNNLLAVILGNLELIEEVDDPDEIRGYLEAARNATHRGADLTKSLLSFARQSRLEPAVININQMVRETKNWSSRVIPANINVEISLLAGLWLVEADPSLTQNALLNLILNARDAMPKGGKMTIETSNVRIDEEYNELRHEDIEPGRYVMLAVSDTGEGIPREHLSQIFDPFFTTKPVGKGSGLGLSMVQGFLKQSGGTVRVYSEEGVGTTIKLYFRVAQGQAGETAREEPASERPSPAGARILVVEDDSAVLDVLTGTLRKAGYDIVSATSGDAALRMWESDPHFDLLVTDIIMPGDLQGTQLARVLRARRHDLPIVFMSGYASEATVHGNGLRPEDIRLMKPVRRDDLIAAVEKALSSGN